MKKEIHEPIEVGNDNERIIKELAQHVNMLVQRVMSTEIALDACLSLLSEKDENFMDNFSNKYKERSIEVNKQIKENIQKNLQTQSDKGT